MTTRHTIIVGGDALIDLVVSADGQIRPVPGGGQYNAARTLARLGADVSFLGAVSDDWFGRLLAEGLRADGVGTDLIVPTSAPTTLALAEIDPYGVARYHFYVDGTSVGRLEADQARAAIVPAPNVLHLGTLGLALEPAADALAGLVDAVPRSTLVMVDPNCRPVAISDAGRYRERMRRVLARADIVKVSTDDLDYLPYADDHAAAAAAIVDAGASVVLVTDGAGPVRTFWHGGSFLTPIEVVEVVDTVGAGDAFGGGFLARWLELGSGREDLADEARLRDAVAFGVRAAAIVCTRPGADPPRRDELGIDQAR